MAITNLTRSVDLNNNQWYLPNPAGRAIDAGYWLIYSASSATNELPSGVGLVKSYKWDTPLTGSRADGFHTIQGTIQIVSESLSGSNNWVKYHGSNIIHIGSGVNDITEQTETDALFFAHLGENATVSQDTDDFFYWDRLYLEQGTTEWDYYNYHAHNPTSYLPFDNGRQAFSAEDRIGESGVEQYAHMININVKSGATNYISVLGRVHTPSIGGAHNSHNDLELGSTTNRNYMMGGILTGASNRFHFFYIAANGSDWDVYSRTYNYTTKQYNAEVHHGTYDLADPLLARTPGSASLYPFRASAGKTDGSNLYIPVIYNSGSEFNLNIWNFVSSTNLAEEPIVTSLLTGSVVRPDCHLEIANNELYAIVSDSIRGGVSLYKLVSGSWEDRGQVVTNDVNTHLRVHGLGFNAAEVKMYTMISGEQSGSGTSYSGSGLYSFSPEIPFDGYKHLDYISGSNSFILRDALENGYVSFDKNSGTFIRSSDTEPAGIDVNTPVLQYQPNSAKFFDNKQISFNGNDQFNSVIELNDGRQLYVGTTAAVDLELDISYTNGIVSIVYPGETSENEYYEITGRFDTYITGVVETTLSGSIYLTGFGKDILTPNKNLLIHGIGRGLVETLDTTNKIEFVDMVTDVSGAQYYVGNHIESSSIVVAKYDENFDLQWQRNIKNNTTSSAYGISIDSSGYPYIVGQTISGNSYSNAVVMKLNTDGSVRWSKLVGSVGYSVTASALLSNTVPPSASFDNEYASSIAIVKNNETDVVLVPVVYTGPLSGSHTTFVVMDTDGNISEQHKYNNLRVSRVRKQETTDDGKFTFAGTQYTDDVTYTITNSGTNNYVFNGGGFTNETDPTLTLYRNNTYTFNVNTSNHPFYIKTSLTTGTGSLYSGSQEDSLHRSGSYVLNQGVIQYTTTGPLKFFVGEDTPDTLYYACALHSGMQGTINILDNSTASFGVGDVSSSFSLNWMGSYTSGSNSVIANDMRNTGTTPEYIVVGQEGNDGFVTKVISGSGGISDLWKTSISGSLLKAVTGTPYTYASESRHIIAVGYTPDSGNSNQGGGDGVMVSLDHTGNVEWINALGHMGAESLGAVEIDVTTDNYIAAGWSESHTYGRRALLFRFCKNGFGTGNHHYQGNAGMAMWYSSASALTSTNSNGLFTESTTPSDTGNHITISSSVVYTYASSSFHKEVYQGSQTFHAFIGKLELNDLQTYKNSGSYKIEELNPINDLVQWTQIGVAGDGIADDGNIFGYDIIELTSGSNYGKLMIAAQTSGDVVKLNEGNTGVYDYMLGIYDPSATNMTPLDSFTILQRGGEFDEEIYALTEISTSGSSHWGEVAFVGRTAGDLGGTPVGGYDLFLGIINPETFVTEYYTTGSGLADRALNVHDIHNTIPNTLAIVFETSGDLAGSNLGAADIGIALFNYDTDVWTFYQIGTTQNENLDTIGKPSVYIPDGRIAIVGTTTGIFADDGNSYGGSDIFVAVFDLNDKTWTKYQIGTGATDIGNGVILGANTELIIAGSTAASFTTPNDAIAVTFNISKGMKGKIS